ncbi:ribosome-inactivating family protein [Streptomyces sp. LN699]|uniref:ribosome-inactivating family protein n=1 Tax=Streptomyces sp. LN699 TaxID=3112981 RepID=UPI0037149BE0
MLRKLCSILLTLATAMGLVTVLSGPASAQNLQVIDWHVSRITDGGPTHAQNYYNLIADIHRLTYGLPTHYEGLAQTTTERGRLVQVRVLDTDNAHLASVYLWADNLYVAGFYAPGSNVHFVFNDRVQEFQNTLGITNARIMPRTGNYTGLPGGNNRADLVLNPQRMYHGMQQLHSPTEYNDNVGSGLLTAIQIFSEASRFSPILDRVRNNIARWESTPLGGGYADLENNWGAISQFAYNIRNNPGASINVLGRVVTSLVGLGRTLGFVELNGSQARL